MRKAITPQFNKNIVDGKPGEIAIGFPSEEDDTYMFKVTEGDEGEIKEHLLAWMEAHLKDQGVLE